MLQELLSYFHRRIFLSFIHENKGKGAWDMNGKNMKKKNKKEKR